MRLIVVALAAAILCSAALKHLYVDQRQDVKNGQAFGSAGPYERIVAKAIYDSPVNATIECLKPRDPSKGNSGLVLLTGKSGMPEALMQRGYTLLRLNSADSAALRDLVSFLRYGGGPEGFLLGDQKRFLKRAILVGDAATVGAILSVNANAKNQQLIDGVVVMGSKGYQGPEGVKVLLAKSNLSAAEGVVELDGQIGGQR